MTVTGDLGDRLEAIPGVASAEVDTTDEGPPIARVRLDGTATAEAVRDRIDALLGSRIPETAEPAERARRSGLGKGLTEVMSSHGDAAVPKHLSGAPSADEPLTVVRVAVVETGSGVSVEVEDSAGNTAGEEVVDSSIDHAVIAAVASLLGIEGPPTIDLTNVDTPAGSVIVATSIDGEDRRLGAAFIDFGRPWAVASAVLAALGN